MTTKAWKNVDEFDGDSLKASEFKIGEAVIGTVEEIYESKNYPGTFFLSLTAEDGTPTRIFTAGTLSYKCKDGKLKPGYIVKITRVADTPSKKKGFKPRTTFEVLVDTDSVEVADAKWRAAGAIESEERPQ
jgi:hypothetical protein